MKWGELLLINEVKHYIESERAKHLTVADKVSDETNNNSSVIITDEEKSADTTASN